MKDHIIKKTLLSLTRSHALATVSQLRALCDALDQTGGIVAPAAKIAGVNACDVYALQRDSVDFAMFIRDLREQRLDEAETTLWGHVQAGNLAALIYYLRCRGRRRGWNDKDVIDVNITDARAIDTGELEALSDDELAKLQAITARLTVSTGSSKGD